METVLYRFSLGAGRKFSNAQTSAGGSERENQATGGRIGNRLQRAADPILEAVLSAHENAFERLHRQIGLPIQPVLLALRLDRFVAAQQFPPEPAQ
jgi:hypothetical protein